MRILGMAVKHPRWWNLRAWFRLIQDRWEAGGRPIQVRFAEKNLNRPANHTALLIQGGVTVLLITRADPNEDLRKFQGGKKGG